MKKSKIIIVGAGIAGLSAARQLNQLGFETLILEARDRYGGRIWPDHSMGIPLGKGASWLHGLDANPLFSLVSALDCKIMKVSGDRFFSFDSNGDSISNKTQHDFNLKLNDYMEEIAARMRQQATDCSLFSMLQQVLPVDFIQTSQEQALFEKKLHFFENYIGANSQYLSAKHWDEEADDQMHHGIVMDAFESLIDSLARTCKIRLNSVVEIINYNKQIELITNQGNFYADAALITVPLGVLKQQSILFSPTLSNFKKSAIEKLGMGLFNIIAMEFDNSFWPGECQAMFIPDSPTCFMFVNMQDFLKKPILLGYVGGDTALALEKQNQDDVIQKTVSYLERFFQTSISFPKHAFMTAWSKDPFSRGSYSYLPVGATGDDRDRLADNELDRLFFAGEATSRKYPATIQGAYLSGIREAEKINQLFD